MQINKFVWSAVSWGSDSPSPPKQVTRNATALRAVVNTTVRDFANLFISSSLAPQLSAVIFGLESAWHGPIIPQAEGPNSSSAAPFGSGGGGGGGGGVAGLIAATMSRVRSLQNVSSTTAVRAMSSNWRWQQLQYRAMYDAFIALRFVRESTAETDALHG